MEHVEQEILESQRLDRRILNAKDPMPFQREGQSVYLHFLYAFTGVGARGLERAGNEPSDELRTLRLEM